MIKRSTKIKRTRLFCLIGILVLALIGLTTWQRMQRPKELIVVARIAKSNNDNENGEWLPTGLFRQIIPHSNRLPCQLALLGWDGKECWHITTPAATRPERRGDQPSWNERAVYSSPDGHVVALLFTDGPYIRVYGWRDGTLCASTMLPRVPGKPVALPLYHVSVLNDGLIWVSTPELPTCRLWRVADESVASGAFTDPFTVPLKYSQLRDMNRLTEDGKVLLRYQPFSHPKTQFSVDDLIHYIAVTVKNDRIITTPCGTVKDMVANYLGNGIIRAGGGLYGPKGKVSEHEANKFGRTHAFLVQRPVQGNFTNTNPPQILTTTAVVIYCLNHDYWVIPDSRRTQIEQGGESPPDEPGICSPDGQFTLLFMPAPPIVPASLNSALQLIPYLNSYLSTRERRRQHQVILSFYARPGKLLARYYSGAETDCFTIDGRSYSLSLERSAISPDGQHIGFSAHREDTDKYEYLFCRPQK